MSCSLPAIEQEQTQQVIVSFSEAVVLVFSVAAIRLHLKSANSRKLSLEVIFHLLHVSFCAVYVGYHVTLAAVPEICLCDNFNTLFVLELGLFAVRLISPYCVSHLEQTHRV
jgi:hypothetical protein